jgi:ankyrin repeat protein/L-ascorbate metabolism protein UlaG (beta-lactamase superfamily)
MKTTMRFIVLAIALTIAGTSVFSQDIYEAVKAGNTEKVAKYLQKDPGLLNSKNPDALTPLNLAAQDGQIEVAQFLLKKGADAELGDNENSGPIHLAAIGGHKGVVDLLLKHGVSIDSRDDNGLTPLHFALSRRQVDMANYLIDQGADVKIQTNNSWSTLQFAVICGDLDLVKRIVEKKADVNDEIEGGFTPLFSAASYGYTDIVKYLVEHGADVRHVDENGRTAIFVARNPNTYDAVSFLIAKGIDVKHRDKFNQTALHQVVVRGSVNVAELLLESGADINAPSLDGRTPLTFATYAANSEEISKFLILNGADVNPDPCKHDKVCTCGPNFQTPLHGAARHGQLGMAKALVSNGARINVYDNEGLTPLHMAVQSGDIEMVSYLVDHGAFLNTPEKNTGSTELHLAVAMGYDDIATLLMEKGSCPRMQDNGQRSPFDYAMQYNHKNLGYQLLASGADDSRLEQYLAAPNPVAEPVAYGEASVWFLGHSGWAVKTQNHFLVFDYFCNPRDRKPGDSCLASGYILPEQLKDQKVTVFATHAHGDHYSPAIFNWKESIPDIEYVLCWNQNTDGNDYTMIPVHEEKQVGDMNVYVNHSTDMGGGYVVEVDGVVLFHMGDHANGEDGLMVEFTDEIDLVAEKYDKIDIVFGGIRGCSLGQPEQVKQGLYYTMEKLQPNLFVPMHAGSHTFSLKEFAETAEKDGVEQKMKYVIHKGDRFVYTKNLSELNLTGL